MVGWWLVVDEVLKKKVTENDAFWKGKSATSKPPFWSSDFYEPKSPSRERVQHILGKMEIIDSIRCLQKGDILVCGRYRISTVFFYLLYFTTCPIFSETRCIDLYMYGKRSFIFRRFVTRPPLFSLLQKSNADTNPNLSPQKPAESQHIFGPDDLNGFTPQAVMQLWSYPPC